MSPVVACGLDLLAKYDRMRSAQRRLAKSKRLDDERTARDAEAALDAAIASLRSLLLETPPMTGFDGVAATPWPGFDEKGVPHAG